MPVAPNPDTYRNMMVKVYSVINYIGSKLISVANYHRLNFFLLRKPMKERFGLQRDNVVMPGIETFFASGDLKRWKPDEML